MKNDKKWGDVVQLRLAAESLADAINLRVRVENRVRSGSADVIPLPVKEHPLTKHALKMEDDLREMLRSQYSQTAPRQVREWQESVPIIASGELFPRIVGLTGNPRHAIPLRMEGTGKNRAAVPDGDPYDRSLRQFWQWCGCGDPDLVPVKGDQAVLLRRGKMTTVRPLLFTFSERLQMHKNGVNVSEHDLTKFLIKTRAEAEGKVHYKECKNRHRPPLKSNGCGIVAHPEWGEPGSPWRDGHKQAHAFRLVQKELMRQFWIAAEGTE